MKVINKETKIGSEVSLTDYSIPIQSQKETTSYGERILSFVDFEAPQVENIAQFESQSIKIWRQMAKNCYIDFAIEDVCGEMLSYSADDVYPIKLSIKNDAFSEKISDMIHDEWVNIMKLLVFNRKSHTLLRDWYIDGKSYYHIEKTDTSISKVTVLDPLRVKKQIGSNGEIAYYYQDIDYSKTLFKINEEDMIELNSGLMDDTHQIWVSYLASSYIPLNQLTSIEDAVLVYRLSRAPERRVFYIDVGELSKSKAEAYMKEVIRNCKNTVEYDPKSGKIKESVRHNSITDDLYLPRRNGSQTTEVSTLQGGSQLGELSDLDYFIQKLFRSLHVPFTRWSDNQGPAAVIGRTAEISRDEVKYRKFIVRLRNQFNSLFYQLLRTQLLLKKITTEEEINAQRENIIFVWSSDSMFAEMRDLDVMSERMNILERIIPLTGTLFSLKYIQSKILHLTDEEIERMEEEIKQESQEDPKLFGKINPNLASVGF